MKLQPAKMGLLRWLVEIRKNPACVGDAEPTLKDIAELCYVFTVPFVVLKHMSPQEVDLAVEQFLEDLEPDDFQEMQAHATAELKRFTEASTRPKKQQPPPRRYPKWLRWMYLRV